MAIETALGGAMQNLVVDRGGGWQGGHPVSEAAGRRPGHHPAPSAPSGPASCGRQGSLSREPGFVGVADQLVQFDPQYRAVFSNLLGRVAGDGGSGYGHPRLHGGWLPLPDRHSGRPGAQSRRLP